MLYKQKVDKYDLINTHGACEKGIWLLPPSYDLAKVESAKINVAPSANPIQKRNVHHVKKGPVAVKKKAMRT